ncbi:NUDIX hydrolase [Falsiroseomonas bella]|uniref:GDP-mannose pyrophosphatase n=1 Tax=Falsiroseomonas bella TaxID=2184016 RepID=A0A317FH26_9PROT|nr:NUDIX hydrolase [Falsiroseomonas bella]PWS38370.1 NUDIX hydrolase [Falsiroseomonas bella]
MRPAAPVWRILDEETVLDAAPWLTVSKQRVLTDGGVTVPDYWQVKLSDFAIAVALTEAGDVITLWQYKHGARHWGLTFPAGHVGEGEDPAAAMRRELREETGFEPAEIVPIGRAAVSGNQGCGTAHMFLMRGCRKVGEAASGDLESMEMRLMPVAEVEAALRQGAAGVLPHIAVWGAARLHGL